MRHSKLLIAASAALLITGLACQAEDKAPAQDTPGVHNSMKNHEMMADHDGAGHRGGDRDGMPHRCMHKGGMMGEGHMPHMMSLPSLPPGNEKLELQMQAEIMQKVGEILARYAGQVKEPPAAP